MIRREQYTRIEWDTLPPHCTPFRRPLLDRANGHVLSRSPYPRTRVLQMSRRVGKDLSHVFNLYSHVFLFYRMGHDVRMCSGAAIFSYPDYFPLTIMDVWGGIVDLELLLRCDPYSRHPICRDLSEKTKINPKRTRTWASSGARLEGTVSAFRSYRSERQEGVRRTVGSDRWWGWR